MLSASTLDNWLSASFSKLSRGGEKVLAFLARWLRDLHHEASRHPLQRRTPSDPAPKVIPTHALGHCMQIGRQHAITNRTSSTSCFSSTICGVGKSSREANSTTRNDNALLRLHDTVELAIPHTGATKGKNCTCFDPDEILSGFRLGHEGTTRGKMPTAPLLLCSSKAALTWKKVHLSIYPPIETLRESDIFC